MQPLCGRQSDCCLFECNIDPGYMCEGLVILCRLIAVYMLVTADILNNSKHEVTTMEQQLKTIIGM